MAGQKPGGVVQIFMPEGVIEMHSSTCAHCQKVTAFRSLKVMHDHVDVCRTCMKLICKDCSGLPCRPWESEAERQEYLGRAHKDLLAMGIDPNALR